MNNLCSSLGCSDQLWGFLRTSTYTDHRDKGLLLTKLCTGLCRRRGWTDPMYECYRDHNGYTCLVLVNGREYQTDLAYESDVLAQENAAMRAFMVCRNFSVNGGMLARNGIVQGLPAQETARRRKSRHTSSRDSDRHSRRSGHHSSSSSTASFD
jgi:hypothetical protein